MSDMIEVDGKQFAVDEEGYLANLNEWVPGDRRGHGQAGQSGTHR